jgi:SAM-dependent methyltransferase
VGFHDPASEPVTRDEGAETEWRDESVRRFFRRLPSWVDFTGKTVLDVGCGGGNMCLHLARTGAAKAVGVDIQSVADADARLKREAELTARCEFHQVGSLRDLGDRRFDAVLSQDSFEHYADPEQFVFELIEPLAPGGLLVIGFGPLWKSPLGGHIGYMTSVPWAHLLFSERVIMAERRRFRPEETARRFEEIRGGLNRMTFARFRQIMDSTGLETLSLETNRGDHPAMRVFRLLSAAAPLEEYFTSNVYGVWKKPLQD